MMSLIKSISLAFLCMVLLVSCTRRLESSSAQMAETSTALQQSTKQQMDELIKLIDSLNQTIISLDKNFLTLVLVLQSMQVDLNELAKVSAPVREIIEKMHTTLTDLFEKKETPNQKTEDIDDLL